MYQFAGNFSPRKTSMSFSKNTSLKPWLMASVMKFLIVSLLAVKFINKNKYELRQDWKSTLARRPQWNFHEILHNFLQVNFKTKPSINYEKSTNFFFLEFYQNFVQAFRLKLYLPLFQEIRYNFIWGFLFLFLLWSFA